MKHDFPTLFKYEFFNVLRGRWLIAYALLFAGFSAALLQFGGDGSKAAVSLMNVILLVVPAVSCLFPAIYWYSSEGFTTLLLTQPLRRKRIYLARWMAVSAGLSCGFLGGSAFPLVWGGLLDAGTAGLLLLGTALTWVFVAVGLWLGAAVPDRMKGIGLAFLVWFYFSVVHDALVFGVFVAFREYPLEVPALVLHLLSPVDLVRVALLMSLDVSALMGFSGALLQKHLGGSTGLAVAVGSLAVWTVVPVYLGARRFGRRDF